MSRRAAVEDFVARIGDGRLRPGDRLPTQRALARAWGVAGSTANAVYAELARRGLVVGEVGRGTFVRGAPEPFVATEPPDTLIDLALNAPLGGAEALRLAASMGAMLRRPAAVQEWLRPAAVRGSLAGRRSAAAFLARGGWRPEPARLVFAGNGKQGLAAAVAALVPPGGSLATDTLTYPALRGVAERLRVELVPLAIDEQGTRPDALAAAAARRPIRAVYLQPVLHNPLGVTMPDRRRRELARLLHRLDLTAIEDAVYAFLAGDEAPLAAHAPDRVVVVESLSKRVAPGLTLGMLVAPSARVDEIAAAVRALAYGPSGFALAVAQRWMEDGTAAAAAAAKRRDAAHRQRLAGRAFAGLRLRADPRSYHGWLELGRGWRAEAFVAAAAAAGVAVTPAAAFALRSAHAPNAVRLAFASPELGDLRRALDAVATIARNPPRRTRSTEGL